MEQVIAALKAKAHEKVEEADFFRNNNSDFSAVLCSSVACALMEVAKALEEYHD